MFFECTPSSSRHRAPTSLIDHAHAYLVARFCFFFFFFSILMLVYFLFIVFCREMALSTARTAPSRNFPGDTSSRTLKGFPRAPPPHQEGRRTRCSITRGSSVQSLRTSSRSRPQSKLGRPLQPTGPPPRTTRASLAPRGSGPTPPLSTTPTW